MGHNGSPRGLPRAGLPGEALSTSAPPTIVVNPLALITLSCCSYRCAYHINGSNITPFTPSLTLAALAKHYPSLQPTPLPSSATALSAVSRSLPFLTTPAKLDGTYVGDYGFDPMGLSDIQADLSYARWAELKHGRICMLAILGMVTQEYGPFGSGWHLPSAHAGQFEALNPFEAVGRVGFEVRDASRVREQSRRRPVYTPGDEHVCLVAVSRRLSLSRVR